MRCSPLLWVVPMLCVWSSSEASTAALAKNAMQVFEDHMQQIVNNGGGDGLEHEPKEESDDDWVLHPKEDEAVACGSNRITIAPGDSVKIQSENYPDNYPNNHRCVWKFKSASPDSFLSITCDELHVTESSNCRKDFLRLKSNEGFKKKLCGNLDNYSKEFSATKLNVLFKTNKRGTAKGFDCTVSASAVTTEEPETTTQPPEGSCKCGQVNRAMRIVGGVETEIHEFPWQLGLVQLSGNQPFCGASIISDRWILTAAHCVEDITAGNFLAVVGEHDYTTSDETDVTQRLHITQVISHPDYDPTTIDNDIALLQVAEPITFDSDNKVAPVCMPAAEELYSNVNATVTGWGTLFSGGPHPDKLHEVTLPTMPNSACEEKYGSGEITDNMICAGDDDGGEDSCQGDSGGPLVTAGDSDQTYYAQIGVVSWGYGCAHPSFPGVYARVSNYLDWINGIIAGSTICPPPTASG